MEYPMVQFETIRLRETGTIAGIDRTTTIERVDVSKGDGERLDEAIRELGFFDVATPVGKGGVISDAAVFDLSITRNGTAFTLHFEMPPSDSANLLALVNLVREIGQGPGSTA